MTLPSAFAAMRQNQHAAKHRSGRRSSRGVVSRIVPAIVFHGDHDKTVHPCNGDQVIAQLREALNIDFASNGSGWSGTGWPCLQPRPAP